MKLLLSLLALIGFVSPLIEARGESVSYAILRSETTAADGEWQKVIAALEKKYPEAVKITFADGEPTSATEELKELRPRYACFVASHPEVTRAFVTRVHQMTRQLDDDPYTDVRWGILTGHDAENALTIAETNEPLVIERVASGTDVSLEHCEEGVWYCELNKNRMVKKEKGGEPVEARGPDDTTKVLVETLNDYQAQLFVTSGHATERDWQIGFRYQNGYFKSKDGQLFGVDTKGEKIEVHSPNPKVYMPIGNCLMGHIDGPDAMALAWLKSAGVRQMLGYTVPTWYGYAGWGCLDYFVEQPGRYSFTEAYLANQHATIHRLETCFPEIAREPLADPNAAMKLRSKIQGTAVARELELRAQDGIGLLFDRDAVAFYGDPAWDARLAKGKLAYDQLLTEKDGVWTFEVIPETGAQSFEPVNTNGSQRGWRPMVAFLPERLTGSIEILEGAEFGAVVTDDFVLLPNPRKVEEGKRYRVVFQEKK
jgi:zinc protease